MKRVLIWREITKGTVWDIYNPTDYNTLVDDVNHNYDGICPNWGNKLWFQGICSEIDDGENIISFGNNESIDEINNKYDLIVLPMANFFALEYIDGLNQFAEYFEKIKIPVYILACGVQARSYDQLDHLIELIGEPSKRFIAAIYSTGGNFALRGYFTKEFFDKLGFHDAVVTGCPSLYQVGRDLQINNEKVCKEQFNPLFNGNISLFYKALDKYDSSLYFDQEQFFKMLYDSNYDIDTSFKSKIRYYHYNRIQTAKLLADNRIKQIPNMNDWYQYLKDNNFNYSFGSRIHGSIMPILAGIPATVLAIDSRTLEMAEFFDIPHIKIENNKQFGADDVYEAYLSADYTKFNNSFSDKFDSFERFLIENGIVKAINSNNKFFNKESSNADFEKATKNTERFSAFYNDLKRREFIFKFADKILELKN